MVKKYKIVKPRSNDGAINWSSFMDYLDGVIIDVCESQIKRLSRDGKVQYIDFDNFIVDISWLEPVKNIKLLSVKRK